VVVLCHILCLLTDDNNDNPIIIRPHIVFNDGRKRKPNHNATTYCVYWRTTTTKTQSCRCVMIGLLLLSSVCNHNMWSYYDWVVVVVFRQQTKYVVVLWLGCRCLPSVTTICGRIMCLMTEENDNPIIMRPHILFTDGRQQRQPNHNTTHIVFTVNTICGRVLIGLSLSSVAKHNMWSYYDWVVVFFRQ
jgi:hypothetical protein